MYPGDESSASESLKSHPTDIVQAEEISNQPSPNEWNQLRSDIADLRQLTMQNIFVTQCKSKAIDVASARTSELQREHAEQGLRCQQLEMSLRQTQDQLTTCSTLLESETDMRESLEGTVYERDERIAGLRQQLLAAKNACRDVQVCTVKLTETLQDVASASEVSEVKDKPGQINVRVPYDEQELSYGRTEGYVASLLAEKRDMENAICAWRDRYAELCADSNNRLLERDAVINTLRSSLRCSNSCPLF